MSGGSKHREKLNHFIGGQTEKFLIVLVHQMKLSHIIFALTLITRATNFLRLVTTNKY
jgi:hypothetical protein